MLTLTIKKKWFDMILSGEKKEEYREDSNYYNARFNKLFENAKTVVNIQFRNGYSKNSPSLVAMCKRRKDYGKEEWGAEKGKLYNVLHICEILGKKNIK